MLRPTCFLAAVFLSSPALAYPQCGAPSASPSADTSEAEILYWGLNNNQATTCGTVVAPDALPITFPFELDPSAADTDDFSFWNAATGAWEPIACAQWGPTSGVHPELTSVTLFLTSGRTPAAGDTLKICHGPLTKEDGTTTPQGYITSQGWCDPTGPPVDGQGIGIVDAFDNGNAGVCASPSSGIMLILSGGARNSSNAGWSLADVQRRLRVTLRGTSTALEPEGLGDSDAPVPDNYYEICVSYPAGRSFADVASVEMDDATAYDPHRCANDGTMPWAPGAE